MKYSEPDRKRRGKRRKKHYFLNFMVFILVVLGLYFLVFHSGVFDIKEKDILVEGNVHYTVAQVTELSGVRHGENIFKTRVSEIKQRLEKDPYIRGADVKWALPDGIVITVDERAESVMVDCGDEYAIVDYDGVVLRMTQEPLIMPVFVGLTAIDPAPGKAFKAEEAGLLRPGLDFIKAVGDKDFYIKKLDLGGVVPKAYVFDRLTIEGDLKNMEKNLDEIKRVVSDLDAKGIERGTISVGGSSCSFSPEVR